MDEQAKLLAEAQIEAQQFQGGTRNAGRNPNGATGVLTTPPQSKTLARGSSPAPPADKTQPWEESTLEEKRKAAQQVRPYTVPLTQTPEQPAFDTPTTYPIR